jgi:hypothetical protein
LQFAEVKAVLRILHKTFVKITRFIINGGRVSLRHKSALSISQYRRLAIEILISIERFDIFIIIAELVVVL